MFLLPQEDGQVNEDVESDEDICFSQANDNYIRSSIRYILANIAERLKKLEDYTWFRSVSKSLRAAAKEEYFEGLRLRQRTPYLMLPVRDGNYDDTREFYSLVAGESIVASVKVANFKSKRCFESLGWLLCSEEVGSMSLIDPFTGNEIPLPHRSRHLSRIRVSRFIQKMVLSARPSEASNFVLMVIAGGHGHLAYWRLGDKAWNRIEDRQGLFCDVVYHGGGQFYAFGNPARVWVFNFSQCDNQADGRIVAYFIPKNLTRSARNLSSDGLSYITTKFQVYEIDTVIGTWKEIYSLGSMAVFLGHNSTIAVDASRFPGTMIKANHIYFTDDNWEFYYFKGPKGGGMDTGIYNLETGAIEAVYPGEPLFSKASPSTWITPCF